ncbi:MAG: hypothetical protein DHS20C19_15940 [Acidimicrobiales bacterium]|nr:MAG: hypothetical protein DHS20C19_15940 [Acidimicrobiales bacterium]
MSDTPNTGDTNEANDSVLRPFEAPASDPLPPVEPSRVVPETPTATEELEPIEALADEPFSVDASDVDDVWSPSAIDAPVVPAPPQNEINADDLSDPLLDADGAADWAAEVNEGDDPGEADDTADVMETLPAVVDGSDTITLPRKGFLVGLGALGIVFLLLLVLWQTAGGDETPLAVTGDDGGDGAVDLGDPTDGTSTPGDSAAAGLQEELADANATVASLEAVVEDLASRPPSALPGDAMRRIVVGADANFISARNDSIAVVGGFGGVSLIDPETNRVIANGNVADSANRVLRTQSSVWITNYQDNQIIQVDPGTNTVQAAFPFPGPDGIVKVGDSIVVASFDEGFVAKIDPVTGQILKQVDVGGSPTALYNGDHGLWVAVFDTGELVRLTRSSLDTNERIVVGAGPVGIGADATHLWVTNNDEGTVAKIDPETAEVVLTVEVGEGPAEVVSVEGSAWVTVSDDGTLVQIDAASGRILSITPLGGAIAGGGPTGIDFAAGSLWIAMQGEQSVVRIDI